MARQNAEHATSADAVNDRQFVKSLARGLDVLKAFRIDDNGLTNAELAKRTGFPKPTVSRLTFTLLALGFLEIDKDTGRYSIHPRILSLGYPVLQKFSIREICRPYLRTLADEFQATAAMGLRDGLEMIVIERVKHVSMISIPVDIGVHRPMATTAMGRAYLAALDSDERSAVCGELKKAAPTTWKRDEAGLNAGLKSYQEHGYTLSDGEWQDGYVSVGAPLTLPNKTVISFVCGRPRAGLSDASVAEMGRRLSETIRQIARIGGRGTALD